MITTHMCCCSPSPCLCPLLCHDPVLSSHALHRFPLSVLPATVPILVCSAVSKLVRSAVPKLVCSVVPQTRTLCCPQSRVLCRIVATPMQCIWLPRCLLVTYHGCAYSNETCTAISACAVHFHRVPHLLWYPFSFCNAPIV